MKIATDEIFGPVQSILKFNSVEEVRINLEFEIRASLVILFVIRGLCINAQRSKQRVRGSGAF